MSGLYDTSEFLKDYVFEKESNILRNNATCTVKQYGIFEGNNTTRNYTMHCY